MHSEHRALFDDDGASLRFTVLTRPGAPMAANAYVPDGRTTADAARTTMEQLPGWILQTEDFGLAAALVKAGARPTRHAFAMHCDLRPDCPLPPRPVGLTSTTLLVDTDDATWLATLPSWRQAYPPDHPDHFGGDDGAAVAALRQFTSGAELGPLHHASMLLRDDSDRPLAGIIVTVAQSDPPWGGPWIVDVWRDPGLHRCGVGTWMIASAKRTLRADGFVTLGLAVSSGNPARRSYEAAGFRVVAETQTVQVPPATAVVFGA
jgi:GNAT superfamily N-acetyltransferase